MQKHLGSELNDFGTDARGIPEGNGQTNAIVHCGCFSLLALVYRLEPDFDKGLVA